MDDVKTVRGTLNGVVVETSEENAERLGSTFVPEGGRRASSRKSASKSDE